MKSSEWTGWQKRHKGVHTLIGRNFRVEIIQEMDPCFIFLLNVIPMGVCRCTQFNWKRSTGTVVALCGSDDQTHLWAGHTCLVPFMWKLGPRNGHTYRCWYLVIIKGKFYVEFSLRLPRSFEVCIFHRTPHTNTTTPQKKTIHCDTSLLVVSLCAARRLPNVSDCFCLRFG